MWFPQNREKDWPNCTKRIEKGKYLTKSLVNIFVTMFSGSIINSLSLVKFSNPNVRALREKGIGLIVPNSKTNRPGILKSNLRQIKAKSNCNYLPYIKLLYEPDIYFLSGCVLVLIGICIMYYLNKK